MIRSLRALSLAAEAEGLRLKREIGNEIRRDLWLAAAAVAGIIALVMLHVAAWHALLEVTRPVWAALIVAAFDLALAGVLALASRRGRDPVAEEAYRLRSVMLNQALHANPIGDLVSLATGRSPAGLAGGMLADWLVSRVRKS
jgi:hypothetical protein